MELKKMELKKKMELTKMELTNLCEICIIHDTYETATHECQTCGLDICADDHALDHERIHNEAKDSTYRRIKTDMENDTDLMSWLFPNRTS